MDEGAATARQACLNLEAAHACGLVNRDLRPASVGKKPCKPKEID